MRNCCFVLGVALVACYSVQGLSSGNGGINGSSETKSYEALAGLNGSALIQRIARKPINFQEHNDHFCFDPLGRRYYAPDCVVVYQYCQKNWRRSYRLNESIEEYEKSVGWCHEEYKTAYDEFNQANYTELCNGASFVCNITVTNVFNLDETKRADLLYLCRTCGFNSPFTSYASDYFGLICVNASVSYPVVLDKTSKSEFLTNNTFTFTYAGNGTFENEFVYCKVSFKIKYDMDESKDIKWHFEYKSSTKLVAQECQGDDCQEEKYSSYAKGFKVYTLYTTRSSRHVQSMREPILPFFYFIIQKVNIPVNITEKGNGDKSDIELNPFYYDAFYDCKTLPTTTLVFNAHSTYLTPTGSKQIQDFELCTQTYDLETLKVREIAPAIPVLLSEQPSAKYADFAAGRYELNKGIESVIFCQGEHCGDVSKFDDLYPCDSSVDGKIVYSRTAYCAALVIPSSRNMTDLDSAFIMTGSIETFLKNDDARFCTESITGSYCKRSADEAGTLSCKCCCDATASEKGVACNDYKKDEATRSLMEQCLKTLLDADVADTMLGLEFVRPGLRPFARRMSIPEEQVYGLYESFQPIYEYAFVNATSGVLKDAGLVFYQPGVIYDAGSYKAVLTCTKFWLADTSRYCRCVNYHVSGEGDFNAGEFACCCGYNGSESIINLIGVAKSSSRYRPNYLDSVDKYEFVLKYREGYDYFSKVNSSNINPFREQNSAKVRLRLLG